MGKIFIMEVQTHHFQKILGFTMRKSLESGENMDKWPRNRVKSVVFEVKNPIFGS